MGYTNCFFSGQGVLYTADRLSNGKPGPLQDLGEASIFKVSLKTETEIIKDSRSGYRLTAARLTKGNEADVEIALEEYLLDNLALGLYGSKVTKAAGTVTGEVLPSGLIAGNRIQLANPKVTFSALKDSAATPATLTAGTHYSVDADPGHLDILDVGSYTQPFKADYSYASSKKIGAFAVPPKEKVLILEGVNTADGYRRVRIVVFKVLLDPLSGMDFLSDDHGKLEMKGSALYDSLRSTSDPLGPFLSYEYLDA